MDSNKGKPMTTSVPSIAIRFNANAEEIEELYGGSADEEEQQQQQQPGATETTTTESSSSSSPLKSYLPKLIKRSASIDTSPAGASNQQESSSSPPSSDPWRFFTDIKGKIEEKLTEIKARKEEESSPRKLQPVKDENETSNVSDSEQDLSESSISKTCGIVSTTEGVEMSSDDDTTPSLEKDTNGGNKKASNTLSTSSGLRRRFKLFKQKNSPKEGTISTEGLRDICSVTSGIQRPLPTDLAEDVESGVDVLLEESGLHDANNVVAAAAATATAVEEEILQEIVEQIDNIEIDEDKVLNVRELNGCETKERFNSNGEESQVTVFSPVGFVDMRDYVERKPTNYFYLIAIAIFAVVYYIIQWYSVYLAGVVAGISITLTLVTIYNQLFSLPPKTDSNEDFSQHSQQQQQQIVEIQPAIKEYQPLSKYEGWMNEYPDVYDPLSYHISQTQAVFVRLQGNLLRLSHTKSKIGKRAMWNEQKIKPNLTYHRIYNLLGAKVSLLPVGLTRKRFWSKKYPICITLSKDQMNFDYLPPEVAKGKNNKTVEQVDKKKSSVSFLSQRFSKLTEDQDLDLDSESRDTTPSPLDSSQDLIAMPDGEEESVNQNGFDAALKDTLEDDEEGDDDLFSLPEESGVNFNEDSPSETKLYLFGRCDREKEVWFRRFSKATHKAGVAAGTKTDEDDVLDVQESVSDTLIDDCALEREYTKFMSQYTQVQQRSRMSIVQLLQYPKFHKWRRKHNEKDTKRASIAVESLNTDILWVNALMARVIFDCVRNENFTARIKERIQRKLSAIKLPYFIEALNLTELSLGRTSPLLHGATTPVIDERGLWIDIDMNYDGLIVLILQTNLNLMKLKQQRNEAGKQREERLLAMFHSDIDDSAESSSNDESSSFLSNMPGVSFDHTPGGQSNASKKVLKMVDKIAESKFFQAATDNKYIKNIMEDVSNTALRLKVEVRSLSGKLVLNIPPPPSDRVFMGFRPVPKLLLSAQPIVGERNITMLRVIHWIEKKLLLEFQKVLVVPNMEDFVVPVMCDKLPG